MRSWKKKIPGINEKLERCFRGIMLHHHARKIYPSSPIPIPGPEYEILYSRPSYRRELGEKWKKQIRKIHYIKIKCQKMRTTGEIRVFICYPYRSRKTSITDRRIQRAGFKRRVKNNILSWKRVRADSIFYWYYFTFKRLKIFSEYSDVRKFKEAAVKLSKGPLLFRTAGAVPLFSRLIDYYKIMHFILQLEQYIIFYWLQMYTFSRYDVCNNIVFKFWLILVFACLIKNCYRLQNVCNCTRAVYFLISFLFAKLVFFLFTLYWSIFVF